MRPVYAVTVALLNVRANYLYLFVCFLPLCIMAGVRVFLPVMFLVLKDGLEVDFLES